MLEALNEVSKSFTSVWGVLGIIFLFAPAALTFHEFTAFRMNHYALNGNEMGCKSNVVNYEARSLNANVVTRRCVLIDMAEISVDRIQELVSKKAGSILISIPQNTTSLTKEEIENWNEVEEVLMDDVIDTSVFFTYQHPELESIFEEVKVSLNSDHAPTATAALGNVFHSNGYQIVGYNSLPAPYKQSSVYTIQGRLTTKQANPTIVITASFDSYGVSPHLGKSANSNGSGVMALLEIARLLSKIYTSTDTTPSYDIVFLLTGASKMNYVSSKTWLDKQLSSDTAEGVLLADAEFVICLDSIGKKDLNFHVSKLPKPDSVGHKILSSIKVAAENLYPNVTINTVPKKVNLGNAKFAWQHELFVVKRLPAVTISNFPAAKSPGRINTFDSTVDYQALYEHVHIISEGIARYTSQTTDDKICIICNDMVPNKALMKRTIEYLSMTERAAQLLNKDSDVILNLEQFLGKYAQEVVVSEFKASKRDPAFQFYDSTKLKLFAYNVKPAVFDLFLAIAVALYLGIVYVIVKSIPQLLTYFYQHKKLK